MTDDIDEMITGITAATRRARAEHLAAGRWAVTIEDGNIVRVYPDGSREVIRPVERR